MNNVWIVAEAFLGITLLMSLYRAVKGPTKGDRIISINVIGTKTLVLFALLAIHHQAFYFLDVMLVFALISFLAPLVIARELEESETGQKEVEE